MRPPNRSILLACLALAGTGTAAGAASAPRLWAHHAYSWRHGTFHGDLIATSTTKLAPGADNVLGSQYPTSAVVLQCPKIPHAGASPPFAVVGFPGVRLKRSHGRFGFASTYAHTVELNFDGGEAPVPIRVTVTIAGSVTSAKKISGKITIKAKGCSLRRTSFVATATPEVIP